MVYQKLLEFYNAAHEILKRRGLKLITKMMLETGHLPTIVQEFLTYANNLQATIQKATADILADISSMLYNREGRFYAPCLLYTSLTGLSHQLARRCQIEPPG